MTERVRFPVKMLVLLVGGLAILLVCASALVQWRVAKNREHIAQVTIGSYGGTYSMQSAVSLRDSGSRPSWGTTKFFNHIAEVNLSVDARPAKEARESGKSLPPLTSNDLQFLTQLHHLQSLDLHGQPVGDEGVKHIKELRHLRKLDISDTDIGETAVSELQSALPECYIVR